MSEIKLEVGKRYLTREGEVAYCAAELTGPEDVNIQDDRFVVIHSPYGDSWREDHFEDGSYFRGENESEYDLVEEIPE